MENKSITINHIAKRLSVSPSTVSRALNNNPKISEATKQKVIDVANELGYDLNLVASSLFKKKTNVIGVIIPVINRYFFSQILSGIEEVARQEGYRVVFAQTNESFEREKEALQMFSSTRVDGVIACLSIETQNMDHFKKFQRKGASLVLFDRVSYDVECSKLVVDNFGGSYQATEHLIKSGCKRLVHLGGPLGSKVFEDRANGFLEALKANNMLIDEHTVLATDLTLKDVRDSLKIWFDLDNRPDGAFTASASSGLNLLHQAKTFDLRIPRDFSIISFGNEPCNEFIEPSLSAIETPGYEMGRGAAKLLLDHLNNPKLPAQTIIKPLQLLIRNSSFSRNGSFKK